jgi:glycosyltransferase involved in cell wall biosynthesis
MNSPASLVSIIIPAYNADVHLPATLERVTQQRYTHWELIVVEDASTGHTEAIVADFALQHPARRVVYLRHEKNQGPSASRNTAIAAAQGKYIALLDADDLWLPDHLQVSVAALEQDLADLVYSTTVMFDDETGQLLHIWGPDAAELVNFPASLFGRNYITPVTVVMRRDIFNSVGLFDTTPDIQGCEDIDYWLRCVKAKIRFACLPGCHTLYRKGHAQQATSRMDRILIRNTTVLENHLGMPEIPRAEQYRQLSLKYRKAGMSNVKPAPFRAASLFLQGWKYNPWRLDWLALSAAAVGYGIGQSLGIIKRDARAR